MEKVIVTRHQALVNYLINQKIVEKDTPVITHATIDDVKNKHVYGVLPLSLAKYAGAITEVPLHLPAELRGKELTIEQVERYAGEAATYIVAGIKRQDLIGEVSWFRKYSNPDWTTSQAVEDLLTYGLHNWA